MIKLSKLISELQITRPKRVWDFTKYIPGFDGNKIQVGDIINIPPRKGVEGSISQVESISETNRSKRRFLCRLVDKDTKQIVIFMEHYEVIWTIEFLTEWNDGNKSIDEIQINTKPTIDYSNIGPYEAEYTGNTGLIDKEGDEILSPNYKLSVCNLGKQYICFTPGGDEADIYLIEKKYIKLGGKDTWFLRQGDEENSAKIYSEHIKEKIDKGKYQILKPKINEIQVTKPTKFKVGQKVYNKYYDVEVIIKSKVYTNDERELYVVENPKSGERYEEWEHNLN